MEVQTDCTNRVVFIKKVIFFLLFYPEKLTPQPHTWVKQSSKYFNTHYFKVSFHSLVNFTSHTQQKHNHLLLQPISTRLASVKFTSPLRSAAIITQVFYLRTMRGFKRWTSDTAAGSIFLVWTIWLLFNLSTLISYLFLIIQSLLLPQSVSTACLTHTHTHTNPTLTGSCLPSPTH